MRPVMRSVVSFRRRMSKAVRSTLRSKTFKNVSFAARDRFSPVSVIPRSSDSVLTNRLIVLLTRKATSRKNRT